MRKEYRIRLSHEGVAKAYLSYEQDAGVWVLIDISVPKIFRGQGWGSELLDIILNDADSEGVTLVLEIVPEAGGLTYQQLQEWYERYGFRKTNKYDIFSRDTYERLPNDEN